MLRLGSVSFKQCLISIFAEDLAHLPVEHLWTCLLLVGLVPFQRSLGLALPKTQGDTVSIKAESGIRPYGSPSFSNAAMFAGRDYLAKKFVEIVGESDANGFIAPESTTINRCCCSISFNVIHSIKPFIEIRQQTAEITVFPNNNPARARSAGRSGSGWRGSASPPWRHRSCRRCIAARRGLPKRSRPRQGAPRSASTG